MMTPPFDADVQPTPEPDTGGEVEGRSCCDGHGSVACDCGELLDSPAVGTEADVLAEWFHGQFQTCIHSATPDSPPQCLAWARTVLASDWLADRLAEAVKAERERIAAADLVALLTAQREWSSETFGPGSRLVGVVDHIRKELVEIEESHGDLTEWIDVVILALDGAWRTGASPEHIVNCLNQKYAKNRARSWPDWRTADPNKAIEHVPDVSDYLDQGCKVCGRDNRNGTHDALESVGHLRHHWQPALARTAPLQDAEEVGEC